MHRPFFDEVTIDLPGVDTPLVIKSTGAPVQPYVASLSVNGQNTAVPVIRHEDIANGGELLFTMSGQPAAWGSSTIAGTGAGTSTDTESTATTGTVRSLFTWLRRELSHSARILWAAMLQA